MKVDQAIGSVQVNDYVLIGDERTGPFYGSSVHVFASWMIDRWMDGWMDVYGRMHARTDR